GEGDMKGLIPVGGDCEGKIRQSKNSAAHHSAGGIEVEGGNSHRTAGIALPYFFDDSPAFRGKAVMGKPFTNFFQSGVIHIRFLLDEFDAPDFWERDWYNLILS